MIFFLRKAHPNDKKEFIWMNFPYREAHSNKFFIRKLSFVIEKLIRMKVFFKQPLFELIFLSQFY